MDSIGFEQKSTKVTKGERRVQSGAGTRFVEQEEGSDDVCVDSGLPDADSRLVRSELGYHFDKLCHQSRSAESSLAVKGILDALLRPSLLHRRTAADD